MTNFGIGKSATQVIAFVCVMVSFACAELPLKVRADQALGQLQSRIQSNDFVGALPWLEKAVALEAEGFKLPSGLAFYAGQIYVKNGQNNKALPFLDAYVNQNPPGKYFWDAVELLAAASPSRGKKFLEAYLSSDSPPNYEKALALYTRIEPDAKIEDEVIAASLALQKAQESARRADSLEQIRKENIQRQLAVNRGTLIDPRDGKNYKTIRIGGQVWMAENLNFATGNSWCYENNPARCVEYGRLYDWTTAKSACPESWHLPSDSEWQELSNYTADKFILDGIALKSKSMGGDNRTEFNALPAGVRGKEAVFHSLGRFAYFWTSTDYFVSNAWHRSFEIDSKSGGRGWDLASDGYSVRCLHD